MFLYLEQLQHKSETCFSPRAVCSSLDQGGQLTKNLKTTLKCKSTSAMANQTNQSMKGRKCRRQISYTDTGKLLDFILSENTGGNDLQHNRMQKKAATATFDKCESPNHDPRKESRTITKVRHPKNGKKGKSADALEKETGKKTKENHKKITKSANAVRKVTFRDITKYLRIISINTIAEFARQHANSEVHVK